MSNEEISFDREVVMGQFEPNPILMKVRLGHFYLFFILPSGPKERKCLRNRLGVILTGFWLMLQNKKQ